MTSYLYTERMHRCTSTIQTFSVSHHTHTPYREKQDDTTRNIIRISIPASLFACYYLSLGLRYQSHACITNLVNVSDRFILIFVCLCAFMMKYTIWYIMQQFANLLWTILFTKSPPEKLNVKRVTTLILMNVISRYDLCSWNKKQTFWFVCYFSWLKLTCHRTWFNWTFS